MVYRSSALTAALLWSAVPAVAAPAAWRPVLSEASPDQAVADMSNDVTTAAFSVDDPMFASLRPFDLPAGIEPTGTVYPLVPLPPAAWSAAACGAVFAVHRVGRAVRRRF